MCSFRFLLFVLLLLGAAAVHTQIDTPDRPNVLFIAIDDLNDYVGYLGGYPGTVYTPNLDRLAARGVAFTNAHVQAPLCGPSRASLMTGLRPSTTGIYGMIADDSIRGASAALDDIITLPEYFGRHGYHTMGIGKLFHHHAPAGAFSESGGRQGGFGPSPAERFVWQGDPGRAGYGRTSTDWGNYPAADSLMVDHQAADWAIARLERSYDEPFFLSVGFIRPHVPWYVPVEWLERYAADSIALPPYRPDDLDDVPFVGRQINDLPMMPSTEWARRTGHWRDIVRAYLASVSFVDHQVGRLLDVLEASPFADNTIIVLWSDHGYRLGEKGTFAKHCLWEEATRVPLIIVPLQHRRPRNNRIATPVELLDLYPTLLELAGLPANPTNEGKSLLPVMRGETTLRHALTTYGRNNHAVRTRHYRYIRYEDGGEELYDHRDDPHEWNNLAMDADARVRTVLDSLRTLLPQNNAPWAARSRYDYSPYFTQQRQRDVRRRANIVVGSHHDEGPADRYPLPYEVITYGQPLPAPLPGLARDYLFTDWDEDGCVDLLARMRRGGGLVLYKNVGTQRQPLFRSLHENEVLVADSLLGNYFALIDADADGQTEVVTPRNGDLWFLSGQDTAWHHPLIGLRSTPRLAVADWDGDGRQDILLGYEADTGEERLRGFHPAAAYDTLAGRVGWLRNLSSQASDGEPRFSELEAITAGGEPIRTYVHNYPVAFDYDSDGRLDLLIGSHDATIGKYRRRADGELMADGVLSDSTGQAYRTWSTVRVQPADLNGDGRDELVGSSYFGNNDRYLVYERAGAGWAYRDYLRLAATETTPVYGMGNSTIDPVDWDGDGDTDLLLGAEGAFPSVVINEGTESVRRFAPAELLKRIDGSPLETHSVNTGDGSHWGPWEWYSDRIAPRAVDWDGDGTLDLISGSMGRRLYFYQGERVGGELRFHAPENFHYGGVDLVVPDRLFPGITDWDGDGRPDVMISTQAGHVVVYPGNRSLELTDPDTLRHAGGGPIMLKDFWRRVKGNRSGFTVADWNGDGRRDLIVYQFHRGVFLFENLGDDTFGEERLLVPLYSHLAGPSVMDWNGDGVPDLLIGGDERRMIEVDRPGHLVVFYGEEVMVPARR